MNEARTETGDLREKYETLKKDFADLAKCVKDEASSRFSDTKDKVVDGTVEWTKEHPAATIGIIAGVSAAVGLALGLMIGRRRD